MCNCLSSACNCGYANTGNTTVGTTTTFWCERCYRSVYYPHACTSYSYEVWWCNNCQNHHPLGTYCPTPHKPEEKVMEEGEKVELKDPSLGVLEEMRAGRDKAVRLAQMENDRASLLEFEAVLRRSKAAMILREVNEVREVKDKK